MPKHAILLPPTFAGFNRHFTSALTHKWATSQDGGRYTYSKELVESYFYYCHAHRKKIDHGIIGGFILYDRLKKNYDRKWLKYAKTKCVSKGHTKNAFIHDGLSWRIEHLDHFAHISDSIIAHNIWYSSSEEDKELYEKYGLQELIEPDKRIIREDHPLLFFLGIVDTIEPTKFFNKLQPQEVWKSIDINYNEEEGSVTINILNTDLDYEPWLIKIMTLDTWLNIEVSHIPSMSTIEIATKE